MKTHGRCALALIWLAFMSAMACSRPQRLPTDAWIGEVAAATRQADRLLDADDSAGARALLRTVVNAGSPLDDDRRVALEDCYFRLAHLALEAHEPTQALADAEQGLSYRTADNLFVANLLVARGAAHEALQDPRLATEDYHRALIMNETLMQQALGHP